MYPEIDRPARNRRRIGDPALFWDMDLEEALLRTYTTGKAIEVSLVVFHSSPAKGRLWTRGWAVRHRVLPYRSHVAAWVEPAPAPRKERVTK